MTLSGRLRWWWFCLWHPLAARRPFNEALDAAIKSAGSLVRDEDLSLEARAAAWQVEKALLNIKNDSGGPL